MGFGGPTGGNRFLQKQSDLPDWADPIKLGNPAEAGARGGFWQSLIASPIQTLKDNAAYGVAGVGALAGGLMGYKGIKQIYQDRKKRQLKEELANTQNAYMDVLKKDASINKEAMNVGQAVGGGVTAAMLLAAIATGGLTYGTLNKFFPAVKAENTNFKPKRIIVQTHNPTPPEDDLTQPTSNINKTASGDPVELLFNIVVNMEKAAGEYELNSIVNAYANGHRAVMENCIKEAGIGALFDLCQNSECADNTLVKFAKYGVIHNPYMRDALQLVAAAKYKEMAPFMVKLAEDATPEVRDSLEKIASSMAMAFRFKDFEKEAMALMKELPALLLAHNVGQNNAYDAVNNHEDVINMLLEKQRQVAKKKEEIPVELENIPLNKKPLVS
jgi:hypothetical protein